MLDSLAEDAIALVGNKSRAILGIAGSPGVGKSTLVEQLLVRIRAIMGEQWAAHVPMDGFHLADVQLERLGVRDRKGAPETFDADGYAHLLLSTTAVNADRIIVNDAAVNSSASKAWGLSDVAARVAVVAMLAATTRAATAAAADDGLGVLDVYGGGLFPVGPVNVVRSAMSSPHGVPPLAVVT
jgi:ABC-type cobalamin/Fe3+-siderophores transport system ATPase subunit